MPAMEKIELRKPGVKDFTTLAGVAFLLPFLVTYIALEMAPPNAVSGKVLLAASAVFVLVTALLWRAVRRNHVLIDGTRLHVHSSFYRLTIEGGDLMHDMTCIEAGALAEHQRPRWRTNGVAFPGYRSGWYRTKGGHRLFAAVVGKGNLLLQTHQSLS